MKRKITWMCILALLANNIFFFNPANVWAEEGSVDVPAQINEETADVTADGNDERPEGVESVTVPTDAVDDGGERPEGIEPVTVPTDAAEDGNERPEGIEPVTVPTDAAEDGSERPEGVQPVTVPTDAAKETEDASVSENSDNPEEKTAAGEPEVSGNETVSENETISENESVSGNEKGTVSDNEENEPEKMIFSVQLPTSPEDRSSFDFVLDPDGLIEKTGAKHYGGKEFQKGIHLFFMNDPVTDDKGNSVSACFSDTSDRKTIVNRSNVPVKVEVKARFTAEALSDNGIIKVCEDPSFAGTDQPAVAFYLTDGDDNKTSMNEEGEISCEAILEEDSEFSFVITGAANPNADWSGMTGGASLDVSWTVQPVKPEEDEEKEEPEESAEEPETDGTETEDNNGETEDNNGEEAEQSISENDTQESVSENEKAEENSEEDEENPSLSGSESGRGFFEGVADPGPYSVIMPTGHEDMYHFIMDPQGLIEGSAAAAYPGKTFEKGQTLYFKNIDKDKKYDFSAASDRLSIVNNGAKPLKITVSASIASKAEISLSPRKDFEGYKKSQLYISVVSGNGQELENITYMDNGVKAEAVIEPADVETFDIDWNEERGYFRVPVSEDEDTVISLPEFNFRVTGAANEKASWKELKKTGVKLNVVWSVEEVEKSSEDGKTEANTENED